MDETELRNRIYHVSRWKKNGQRTPQTPLFLLLALAKLQQGKTNMDYEEVRDDFMRLLSEYGPPREMPRAVRPFINLVFDGIWVLNIELESRNYTDSMLVKAGAVGAFRPDVLQLLKDNSILLESIAEELLHSHFAEKTHNDLLRELGLRLNRTTPLENSSAAFRKRILEAYDYSCAICGSGRQPGTGSEGLEAAHIQWPQAGGPDSEENGVALCPRHSAWYSRGALGITPEREILVAQDTQGIWELDDELRKLHGTAMRLPVHPVYLPHSTYLNWHLQEVFRGPVKRQLK